LEKTNTEGQIKFAERRRDRMSGAAIVGGGKRGLDGEEEIDEHRPVPAPASKW